METDLEDTLHRLELVNGMGGNEQLHPLELLSSKISWTAG
jgi:hypothetical protein